MEIENDSDLCVVCVLNPKKYGKAGMCGGCYYETRKAELKKLVLKPEFSPEPGSYLLEISPGFEPIYPADYKKIPSLITV